MKDERDRPEIRVRDLPKSLKEELKIIAKNSGVTLNDFLKPKLREIANSYPAEMKVRKFID